MSRYPTGVEAHGESLRIWFMLNGKRERESLGVPDTQKNRKIAGELRASICYAIKTGIFDYAKQFPNSQKFKTLNEVNKNMTIKELAAIWLGLKEMEITKNAHNRYCSYIAVCISLIGENEPICFINLERIMSLRKELLLGNQMCGVKQKNRNIKSGRSVRTVNVYITCFKNMLQFASMNGYIDKNPANAIKPLKKEKSEPDPLTKDEYLRLLDSCKNEQTKNLWILAVNTGMRHGEISALSWEDIDTKKWEISINRNIAVKEHFTPPKTESGIRVVSLTIPAINALKRQMLLTKMGKTHKIKVNLREYGRVRIDNCTFVFSPMLSSNNSTGGAYYSVGSIGATWNAALKRAGIRHRKAYESRHTYACWALSSGANPSFIANQMGHTSAQMIYTVYGKWMSDKNDSQIALLNQSFEENAPLMPQVLNR